MVREIIAFDDNMSYILPYKVINKLGFFDKWYCKKHNIEVPESPLLMINNVKYRYFSLNTPEWNVVRRKAINKERILLFKDGNKYQPLTIKKEIADEDGYASEALDSDLLRTFNDELINTSELTKNKWAKLAKMIVTVLLVILALGAAITAIALLSKVSTDQLGVIRGTVDAQGSSFLNATTKILGG